MVVEAPTEAVDGRVACRCCGGSGREPAGLHESPRTGRRYTRLMTASGTPYGLEHGGRFVMVTAGGHTIEKGRGGCMSLDRFVDQLADKLGKRAAAIEKAKATLAGPKQRAALDGLLQHWFRWPTEWPSALKRTKATIKGMGLTSSRSASVGAILNHPECRSTWND